MAAQQRGAKPGDDPFKPQTMTWFVRAFGIGRHKLEKALGSVEPDKTINGRAYYTIQQVHRAVMEQADSSNVLDYTKERAALAHEQAKKAKLEAEVMAGNLLHKEDVVEFYGELVSNAKARLLGLPSKAAIQMDGMTVAEREDFLTDLVHEALHELANADSDTMEAAAETNG